MRGFLFERVDEYTRLFFFLFFQRLLHKEEQGVPEELVVGKPFRQALDEIRAKHKIPRRKK